MHLVVIGDIHAQADKFWLMMQEAGLCDNNRQPSELMRDDNTRLVLLGDLVHAKSRQRYSELIRVHRYDEYNPKHIAKAEKAQVTFLKDVKRFCDELPKEQITILMGNHDFNTISPEQGPLRTDDVSHLEWKEGYGGELCADLREWISSWPYELVIDDIHLAHVGPLAEHNRYDNDFYLDNRRRWIYEETDYLAQTPYRLGIYGHTPVRGGVNITSQGRAILLDTNGHRNEYSWLEIDTGSEQYHLKMHGLFFDEIIQR